MNFFKKVVPFALGFVLMAGAVFAQGQQTQPAEDVSDQELEAVVDIALQAQQIQQKMQMEMQQLVQDSDLSMQRFQMIYMSKQNPQMADSINVSAEEEKAFQALQPELQKLNTNAQQQIDAVVQESEITQQRLKQIQQAFQADQQLQQRFQKMMMQKMQSQNQGSGDS